MALSEGRQLKVAYFTPTHRGVVWWRTWSTAMRDAHDMARCGRQVLDMSELIAPSSCVEKARNIALKRARNAQCDMLYMVDSDVATREGSPLSRLIHTMKNWEATIAAAAVCVRGGKDAKLNVHPVQHGAIYEAEHVSAAMMLIDLRRLQALQIPESRVMFKRLFNDAMTSTTVDEGVFFSRLVRSLGGKVVADTTIATMHRTSGELEYTPTSGG